MNAQRGGISAWRKGVYSAVVLAIFLVGLELGLRFATTGTLYLVESNPHYADERGAFRLRPNSETWWYGFHYDVNALGFRMNRELGAKRGVRVVALGDSITEGMGVRRSEDTWPFALERLVAQRGLGPVESVNTGIQGWNLLVAAEHGMVPGQFTRFLRESGRELDPDIVVYAICLNDTPSLVHKIFEIDNQRNRRRFAFFPERSREWLKRKALYRLLRDGYRELRFRGLDYSSAPAPPSAPKFWRAVSAEIAALKKAASELDAVLYAVVIPYSYQLLPQNADLLALNRQWHAVLTDNDVPFSDLSWRLDGDTVQEHFAFGDYIHLNEKGHELLAREALSLIEGRLGGDGGAGGP